MSNGLEHGIGPMGWGVPNETVQERMDYEKRHYDQCSADMPMCYRARPAMELMPAIKARYQKAMSDKGYDPAKSACLHTFEEMVFGKLLDFLPQDIGSCVTSNTLRPWVQRALIQIAGRGDAEEYLGTKEFSPDTISFYGPQSYGMARKRANMKSGDGLYCEVFAESLMKDGVLDCNTPRLREIMASLNCDDDRKYPEPIGRPEVYRAFGAWKYIDELRQFCDYRLLSSVLLTNVDQHLKASQEYKSAFQCSMIAIKKIGTHRDGFDIHGLDPGNSWAHNMGWSGHFVTQSTGELFFCLNNKSWGPKARYNIPYDELDKWYKRKLPTTMTLEEIDLPDSRPASI